MENVLCVVASDVIFHFFKVWRPLVGRTSPCMNRSVPARNLADMWDHVKNTTSHSPGSNILYTKAFSVKNKNLRFKLTSTFKLRTTVWLLQRDELVLKMFGECFFGGDFNPRCWAITEATHAPNKPRDLFVEADKSCSNELLRSIRFNPHGTS